MVYFLIQDNNYCHCKYRGIFYLFFCYNSRFWLNLINFAVSISGMPWPILSVYDGDVTLLQCKYNHNLAINECELNLAIIKCEFGNKQVYFWQ